MANGKEQKKQKRNAATYVPHLHDVRPAKAVVKNGKVGSVGKNKSHQASRRREGEGGGEESGQGVSFWHPN